MDIGMVFVRSIAEVLRKTEEGPMENIRPQTHRGRLPLWRGVSYTPRHTLSRVDAPTLVPLVTTNLERSLCYRWRWRQRRRGMTRPRSITHSLTPVRQSC